MILPALFDMNNRLESLCDQLEKLKEVVDFYIFRSEIEEGSGFADRSKGERPPYDSVCY